MASLVKWWYGVSDKDLEEKEVISNEDKEKLHQYVSVALAEDLEIKSGDLVLFKDIPFYTDKNKIGDVYGYIFTRGPAYVVCVNPVDKGEFLGRTANTVIAYSDGEYVQCIGYDSRCLRPITNDERMTLTVDPVLKAFINDGINLSECTVKSDVRPRAGTRFFANYYTGCTGSILPMLDFATVLWTPSFINAPTNTSAPMPSVSCTDDITLVGVDVMRRMHRLKVKAYNLCRADTSPPLLAPPSTPLPKKEGVTLEV